VYSQEVDDTDDEVRKAVEWWTDDDPLENYGFGFTGFKPNQATVGKKVDSVLLEVSLSTDNQQSGCTPKK